MKLEGESLELAKSLLPEIDWNAAGEEVTIDKVAELKSAALITRELHKKEVDSVFGKTIGPIENEIRPLLGEEGKGKMIKDMLPLLKERYSSFASQVEELKSKAGEGKDKLLSELTQYKTLAEQQESKLKEYQAKLEESEKSAEARFEAIQLNHTLTSVYDKQPWTDDADEYVKKGIWNAEIEGRYNFKREGEKVLVYDKDGNIVQSGTGHMTADELFRKTLEKANRLKKNGATGAPAQTSAGASSSGSKLTPQQEVHLAKLRERAEKMKSQ